MKIRDGWGQLFYKGKNVVEDCGDEVTFQTLYYYEPTIAVVVPTISSRKEIFEGFMKAWKPLFDKHSVIFIKVLDGDEPQIEVNGVKGYIPDEIKVLIFNKNDGVRNFGFWYIAKFLPKVDTIITLDDDTLPIGDTIQDHLDALDMRVPISWMSTASEYMRGFPYYVREEAEVVLSHGVWQGVADWDAPTQLIKGNRPVEFYKGAIPRWCYYPMCGMNIAFKRKMLPCMYYAPMGHKVGLDRFADIWCGIESKKEIDMRGWAVVTGYATVRHERASNVWNNLIKESKGLSMNEQYDQDPYFRLYAKKREEWKNLILSYETSNNNRKHYIQSLA